MKFPQIRLGYGVIISLVAHSIEVALFALAYKVSIASGFGALEGNFGGSIADHLYFSYAAFTTVGFGDIVPSGPLRLTGRHGSFDRLCTDHLDSVVLVSGNDPDGDNSPKALAGVDQSKPRYQAVRRLNAFLKHR